MEIKSSILDYLGKFEDGIMVLIALTCDNEYYEGVFYYNSNSIVLSVDERLEEKMGHRIEEYTGYVDLLRGILKNVVPYTQMIGRIDEVDFSQYLEFKDGGETEGEDINASEVDSGTQSSSD
jgi:hypothetical protein